MLNAESNKPGEHRKAAVVACDSKFAPFALLLLDQILRLENSRDFDVCLVSQDDLRALPLVASGEVRFIRLLDFAAGRNLPTNTVIPLASYIRLFLPGLLGDEYDRILYLDSDVYLRRSGLSELFATDLGAHAIAATRDIQQFLCPGVTMRDFELLGFQNTAYLNAGVLLIDCQRFRNAGLEQICLEFIRQHPDIVELNHDQSVLNCVLRGDWKELPPKWNWMYTLWTLNSLEKENPVILHFTAYNKPWISVSGEVPKKYYDAYHGFLSKHFPQEAKAMPHYKMTSKANWRLWRYVVRNWFIYPRFRRYARGLEQGSPET